MRNAESSGSRRWERAGAWALLALCAATAIAAPCIAPKVECTSGSGFCQGTVVVCSQGWEDASVGWACTGPYMAGGFCYEMSSCAPYPCSQPPPSGSDPLAIYCRDGGQCCSCITSTGTPWSSGQNYYYYTNCVACAGSGGGDD